MQRKIIAFVLAGGSGTRLLPLTKGRAKPAISIGGKYRIIDFVLSNLINSGIHSIYVLVQFQSQSLLRHLRQGWQFANILSDQFIIPVPAQKDSPDGSWYRGTADAVYQNLNLIDNVSDQLVAIFGGDHIYRMDVGQMVGFHEMERADVTVAALPVEERLAADFGVIEAAEDGRIMGFHEKRIDAPRMSSQPHRVFASMGNYLFSASTLLEALRSDSERTGSTHDFGRDILPVLLKTNPVYSYDFRANCVPGEAPGSCSYWKDVGTLQAYYDAQMDLCSPLPALNLYNPQWPIRTASYADPCAKFTFDNEGRAGQVIGSLVSGGCIVAGGSVRNSVVGRNVRISSGALIEDSVVLDNCVVGRNARIRRAILDEGVTVAEEVSVGHDDHEDRQLHHVTERGIVVVAQSSDTN
ncbi:MAG: glucose-1-phosphate adenylyltransferase [Acidobacteriota bacterium]|nr:MAG: glucose-1-phosphate adenylyltransferase [Acidobacteriota bacterium]